jgi:PadR family transcriptional regulator PadR
LALDTKIDARPRAWLTPVILVLLREERSYGCELMKRTIQFGFESINPGTVYRTLRQMEQEELCQSEWEISSSGPARRTYSITDKGVEYLDAWAKACKEYQSVLGSFSHAYTSNRSLRSSATPTEHDERHSSSS